MATGSPLASRTVPRERGRRKAVLSVTPGMGEPRHPRLDARAQAEVELDVGRARASCRRTRSRRSRTGWRPPGPLRNSRYCRPAHRRAVRAGVAVVGVVAGALGDDEEIEMVLQVGADARQVVHRPRRRPRAGGRPGRCRRAGEGVGEPMAPEETITSRPAPHGLRPRPHGDLDADGAPLLHDDPRSPGRPSARSGSLRSRIGLQVGDGSRRPPGVATASAGSGRCRPGPRR